MKGRDMNENNIFLILQQFLRWRDPFPRNTFSFSTVLLALYSTARSTVKLALYSILRYSIMHLITGMLYEVLNIRHHVP